MAIKRRKFTREFKLRLMPEDNLLCLRKKGFARTTDSGHGLRIYPNLVPELVINDLVLDHVNDLV